MTRTNNQIEFSHIRKNQIEDSKRYDKKIITQSLYKPEEKISHRIEVNRNINHMYVGASQEICKNKKGCYYPDCQKNRAKRCINSTPSCHVVKVVPEQVEDESSFQLLWKPSHVQWLSFLVWTPVFSLAQTNVGHWHVQKVPNQPLPKKKEK